MRLAFWPHRAKEKQEERDEDTCNGIVWAGGDRTSERAGAGGAHGVPIGTTAERSQRGGEGRVRGVVESGNGRIGWRGRGRRCGCELGRRIDCGGTMDNSKEGSAALQPHRYYPHPRGHPREDECAAKRAGVGIADWDLRRSRRRNADGGGPAMEGFSCRAGARV